MSFLHAHAIEFLGSGLGFGHSFRRRRCALENFFRAPGFVHGFLTGNAFWFSCVASGGHYAIAKSAPVKPWDRRTSGGGLVVEAALVLSSLVPLLNSFPLQQCVCARQS